MTTTAQYSDIFDVGSALRSVGGDREFLGELLGLTQAAWPTLLADIHGGLERRDFGTVETCARLVKAAARNVSARRTYESALHLETMAHGGNLPAAQKAHMDLEREVDLLRFILGSLGRDEFPPAYVAAAQE